jgi:energy-coupling factor transport system permease protein
MQDARIRLFSFVSLSIATFLSVPGAVLSLGWLLLSPGTLRETMKSAAFWVILLFVTIIATATQMSGKDGLSYFIRTGVIILLGFSVYREWHPGEYLDLSVWLFGKKAGFDIGLAVEMSIQGLHEASREFARIRSALSLKGLQPGIRLIPAVGFLMIHTRLMRARDQADLLATRGYRAGGSCCPVFRTSNRDITMGILAILVVFLSFMPVRDIFILQM